MKLLLKKVCIIDPGKSHSGQTVDILIRDGIIERIGNDITAGDAQLIEGKGVCVSPGWFDLKANFRDPGDELKENISSGLAAAANGGFTHVLVMPSTNPPIQTKADIEYIKARNANHPVTLHPAGVLSAGREGKDISEMFDMKTAGAVAFTDDKRPVSDSGLMMRALQYASNVDTVLMTYSDDPGITGKGIVNEGLASTISGLKSAPGFAEELMVARDIEICRYAGGRLHFSTVSTAGAVELIRKAKKDGLKITADVCAHQLFFDDSVITGYDTNYKVKPPFRSSADREALINGIMDGTIDAVVSDHAPQDLESRMVEFDFAAFGIAGIETAFGAARTACKEISLERLIEVFSSGPRKVIGLEAYEIKEGAFADLTLFQPDAVWQPINASMKSMAGNNPFFGMDLTGKVIGIVARGQYLLQ